MRPTPTAPSDLEIEFLTQDTSCVAVPDFLCKAVLTPAPALRNKRLRKCGTSSLSLPYLSCGGGTSQS